MGLIISTKEIDAILLESIETQLGGNENFTLPYKKEILGTRNRLIASTITNSFGQDSKDSSSSKISFAEQEKANTNEYPMNCIGLLTVTFANNITIESTCSLISYNKVITLITNIYHEEAGKATGVVLTHESQKYYNLKHESMFPLYNDSKLAKHNYIILTFDDLIVRNWFGIESPKIEHLYKREISLAGYITDEHHDGLYTINGKILKHQDYSVKYSIYTFNGQEGSPLFIKASNNNDNNSANNNDINDNDCGANIIGLNCFNIGGEDKEKQGYGIIINYQVLNWIKSIIEEEEASKIERNIIEKLDFSKRGFGPGEMEYFFYFQLIHLKEIDLTSNKIKARGAYYLSQGQYPNLTKLSLNNNEIGDLGTTYISRAHFTNLTELRLFNNHLTHNGIDELSNSLFCSVLKLLDLSENPKIKDKGVKLLEKKFQSLVELYLHYVGMTNASIRVLRDMKSPLTKLIISGNTFTSDIDYIINALKKVDRLTVII